MRPSELGAIADEVIQRCTHGEAGTLCRPCLIAVLGYVAGRSPGADSDTPDVSAARGGEAAPPEQGQGPGWAQPEYTVLVGKVR